MECICPPEGPFKVKWTWREIIEREGNLCAAAQTDSHIMPTFLHCLETQQEKSAKFS